jgi:hypothetical protein
MKFLSVSQNDFFEYQNLNLMPSPFLPYPPSPLLYFLLPGLIAVVPWAHKGQLSG